MKTIPLSTLVEAARLLRLIKDLPVGEPLPKGEWIKFAHIVGALDSALAPLLDVPVEIDASEVANRFRLEGAL